MPENIAPPDRTIRPQERVVDGRARFRFYTFHKRAFVLRLGATRCTMSVMTDSAPLDASHTHAADALAAAAPSIVDTWLGGSARTSARAADPEWGDAVRDESARTIARVAARIRGSDAGQAPSLSGYASRCHDAGIAVDEMLLELDRLVALAIEHVGDRAIEGPLRALVARTVRDRVARDREAGRELGELAARFASRAAHDIRQPLNAITLHTTLIGATGDLGARQREACDRIDRAARNAAELVDKLRTATFSIDLGAAGRSAALGDTLGRTLDALRPIAAARDVTIRVEAVPDVDVDAMRAHLALAPTILDAIERVTSDRPDRVVAVDGALRNGTDRGLCDLTIRASGAAIPDTTSRFLASGDEVDPVAPGMRLARAAATQTGGAISVVDDGTSVVVSLPVRRRSRE